MSHQNQPQESDATKDLVAATPSIVIPRPPRDPAGSRGETARLSRYDEDDPRLSYYTDRTSRYTTATEDESFESASEGLQSEDEVQGDGVDPDVHDHVDDSTAELTQSRIAKPRTFSLVSQSTIRAAPSPSNSAHPTPPSPTTSTTPDPFASRPSSLRSTPGLSTRTRTPSTGSVVGLGTVTGSSVVSGTGPSQTSVSPGHARTSSNPSNPLASYTRNATPPMTSVTRPGGRPSTSGSGGGRPSGAPGNSSIILAGGRPSTSGSSSVPARPSSLRETFSSPPMMTGYITPASGTTTPRDGSTQGSAVALTQYVPGLGNPFATHSHYIPAFPTESADARLPASSAPPLKISKSTLLEGEVHKPWLAEHDWRTKAAWWITVGTAFLGVAASAVSCYFGYANTRMITQPLCLVMEDNFDTFNVDKPGSIWTREVDMSGFGNGEFEMTTNSPNNTFVRNGQLYIVPTLTSLSIPGGNASVFNGFTYNITGCTNAENRDGTACGAVSNKTAGTIINPVMSGRLTTQKSHNIQYGKVEIRAKLPLGDWLWPALWMLPVDNAYGPWPLSGEIDIMESRGNDPRYPGQGINVVRGSLNWGPTVALNAVSKTFGFWSERRKKFSSGFHTYSLEWTPDWLRVYVDTRLHNMLDLRFNEPFFDRGKFPAAIENNSQIMELHNPWIGRGNSAPFDKPFFLIMNVAVGGTNGWFPDNLGGKPWVNGAPTAMRDFALAQDQWYPTWPEAPEDRAMVIDYVRMWKLC